MLKEQDQVIQVFKEVIESSLIQQNMEKVLSVITEDVIGIGMGAQGVVSSKADLAQILQDGKSSSKNNGTTVEYANMLVRCYSEGYATVCAVLKIRTVTGEKTTESSLGQLMNMRKEDEKWMVYTMQATPLFQEIEEMEAYPIKFAENVLGKYRQQEQISKNVQNESAAIYGVNFSKGIFENAVVKSDIVIDTQPGSPYEDAMFEAAKERLEDEDRYKFMSTFSLGNIFKAYQNAETELSLEYKMMLPKEENHLHWMKSVIKLYVDKSSEDLMGYLYVFDIHREKMRELELENNAHFDSLTELYNRKYAEKIISEKLKKVISAEPGVFFMIDLDYFKNINDTYGHQEGDRVIREAALCIKKVIHKEDLAGRIGGDEFCIYFQGGLTIENVRDKADLLCEEIRRLIPDKEIGTSCSIGITFCQRRDATFTDIYNHADKALYQQKKNGRNGYTIFSCEDLI